MAFAPIVLISLMRISFRIVDGMDALLLIDLILLGVVLKSYLALSKDGNDMKKLNKIASFCFFVVMVQLVNPVSAKEDKELIEKLDLDKDGQITIKEAVANPAVLASFGKIDRDGDGKISPVELAKTKVTLKKAKSNSKPYKQI